MILFSRKIFFTYVFTARGVIFLHPLINMKLKLYTHPSGWIISISKINHIVYGTSPNLTFSIIINSSP